MDATMNGHGHGAALRAALAAGQREAAQRLAAQWRSEQPEEVQAWLWAAWLCEDAVDALGLANHAAKLAPSAATEQALAWSRRRLRDAMKPPTDAELLVITDSMQALSRQPATETAAAGRATLEAEKGRGREEETTAEAESAASASSLVPGPSPLTLRPSLLVAGMVVALVLLGLGLWVGSGSRREALGAVATVAPALQLKEEAGRLWVAGQRETALAKWEEAHRLSPFNVDIRQSLARAHVALSTDWLQQQRPEQAFPHLEAAYELVPEEEAVVHEYQALRAYLAGREAMAAQRWDEAVATLMPLYGLDRGYLDVAALVEVALAGEKQAEMEQAAQRDLALGQARLAQPGRSVRALLAPTEISNLPGQEAMPALGPFAGPAGDQHIVVSINAQRMYVYEGGELLWNWTASTGESARPTIPGRYRIQSKIENARSNVWSLWMPYWQGIYWAGSVENGIHGQVTFDSGGRLWEGYLGTRITFGCVMISDENAATLFNWTEMGTPISIHWEWDPSWVPDANGDPL